MDQREITTDDIGKAITGMLRSFEAEYEKMSRADLEGRWHFKYSEDQALALNMWRFHDALALYAGSCRRWEEMHNGRACVVERVRDNYLLPKIREFEASVRAQVSGAPQ